MVLLTAGATAMVIMLASDQPTARPPDLLGGALLASAAMPLLARRRWPVGSVVAIITITMAYLASGYPGGAELPLVMIGLYSMAAVGQRWWTVLVVGMFAGWGAIYRLIIDQQNLVSVLVTTVLLVLVCLLGDGVHTRRRLRWEVRERLRAAEAEQELETQSRLTEERLRIAHEFHDVMAHTITTMTVQTGVAADLLPNSRSGHERSCGRPVQRPATRWRSSGRRSHFCAATTATPRGSPHRASRSWET